MPHQRQLFPLSIRRWYEVPHIDALRLLGEGLQETVDMRKVVTISTHYTGGEGEASTLLVRTQYSGGEPPWADNQPLQETSQWLSDGVAVPEEPQGWETSFQPAAREEPSSKSKDMLERREDP